MSLSPTITSNLPTTAQGLGKFAYQLAFEISPIILTGGIAQNLPYKVLPIAALTQAASIVGGLLHFSANIDLDNFYAHFKPITGATLVNNEIGRYPFANQQTAANAIIFQPLNVSMLMTCPPNMQGGLAARLTTIMALKATLDNHNLAGGLYTVITPSYTYTNCILKLFKDVSSGASKNPQIEWQLDFEQPLTNLDQATATLSTLMNKMTNGVGISPPSIPSGWFDVLAPFASPISLL